MVGRGMDMGFSRTAGGYNGGNDYLGYALLQQGPKCGWLGPDPWGKNHDSAQERAAPEELDVSLPSRHPIAVAV